MEWINKIQDTEIKKEISLNEVLTLRINTLIPMTANQIKKADSKILKGISYRIAEELFQSGVINNSQYKVIKKQKENNGKQKRRFKKSCK